MKPVDLPTPFVKWLRRQRRLSWWAIILCLLVRIGGAALLAGDPIVVPVARAAAAAGRNPLHLNQAQSHVTRTELPAPDADRSQTNGHML
jgi:hypothetical protein